MVILERGAKTPSNGSHPGHESSPTQELAACEGGLVSGTCAVADKETRRASLALATDLSPAPGPEYT